MDLQRIYICVCVCRSVYLHNNKLTDAGLPEDMFNGSSSLEVLIMSSNFLRSVPKNLPPALYRLHLKVSHYSPTNSQGYTLIDGPSV